MTTINVSIPEKLKDQAQSLVDEGFFVSFSDLVRHSLRQIVSKNKYDMWADEAEEDMKKGKGILLRNKKEIKKYFDSL